MEKMERKAKIDKKEGKTEKRRGFRKKGGI